MPSTKKRLLLFLLILAGVAVVVGLTWANYQLARENPGGNDFLSRWLGIRRFLTRGWSPYSVQTSRAIQEMVYGRPAQAGEDQVLFVYPFYSLVIIAPYALIQDYTLARALWMTTLEVLLVVITWKSIALVRWHPPSWLFGVLMVFSVLWYHGLRPVVNGNPSVWVALFIVMALSAIHSQNYGAAGAWLALTLIKPQMVVLLVPFILLWALWTKRRLIVLSFLGTLGLLIGGTMVLIPDWPLQNLQQVLAYPAYTLPGTPRAFFMDWLPGIGSQLGWLLTIGLGLLLLWEWAQAMKGEGRRLIWTVCLTLVATNLIGIRTTTANYVAMVPGLMLVFSVWDQRWSRVGRLAILGCLLLFFGGLWALFLNTLVIADQPLQSPLLFFPLPLFLLITLYWVLWWFLRPPRVFFDQVRQFMS